MSVGSSSSVWLPIETAPHNQTIILANFDEACLLTGAPHVWTATYVTRWQTLEGKPFDDADAMWCECSHAAMNKNGDPTHWMPLPPQPDRQRTAEPDSEAVSDVSGLSNDFISRRFMKQE